MLNDNLAAAREIIRSIKEPRQTALAAHLGIASCRLTSWKRTLPLHDPRDLPIHADRIAKWAESHPLRGDVSRDKTARPEITEPNIIQIGGSTAARSNQERRA